VRLLHIILMTADGFNARRPGDIDRHAPRQNPISNI
jgi:hypothetical protein